MATPRETVVVDGRDVSISNPEKVFFPRTGHTKMDVVRYYLSVMPGALLGVRDRPTVLKRFPNGAEQDFFFQKRVPEKRPSWLETVNVTFPSGRDADELCPQDGAHIIWAVNLGCIDLNPWPVRRTDVDHPDELRVDLDPTDDVTFADVRTVALVVRDVLGEHGLEGFPKTSGSRGIHINVRIEPAWTFTAVRRAALAMAREVERRCSLATTAWWKEERVGVFLDYNQNARDRTVASAYSLRPVPDAHVSCPITWDEAASVQLSDFTIDTVPARFAQLGDVGAAIDAEAGSLEQLLALARRDEEQGLGDAPWPPHFPKGDDEPRRVQPSKARQDEAGKDARRRQGPSGTGADPHNRWGKPAGQ